MPPLAVRLVAYLSSWRHHGTTLGLRSTALLPSSLRGQTRPPVLIAYHLRRHQLPTSPTARTKAQRNPRNSIRL